MWLASECGPFRAVLSIPLAFSPEWAAVIVSPVKADGLVKWWLLVERQVQPRSTKSAISARTRPIRKLA